MSAKEITSNLGFQQIATLTTAQSLTIPAGTRVAIIHADTQAIRWRDDGTAPIASVGMLLPIGESLRYDGELTKLKLIEEVGGAKANISYYA